MQFETEFEPWTTIGPVEGVVIERGDLRMLWDSVPSSGPDDHVPVSYDSTSNAIAVSL